MGWGAGLMQVLLGPAAAVKLSLPARGQRRRQGPWEGDLQRPLSPSPVRIPTVTPLSS